MQARSAQDNEGDFKRALHIDSSFPSLSPIVICRKGDLGFVVLCPCSSSDTHRQPEQNMALWFLWVLSKGQIILFPGWYFHPYPSSWESGHFSRLQTEWPSILKTLWTTYPWVLLLSSCQHHRPISGQGIKSAQSMQRGSKHSVPQRAGSHSSAQKGRRAICSSETNPVQHGKQSCHNWLEGIRNILGFYSGPICSH